MSAFTVPEIAWAQLTPVLLVLGAAVVGVLVEAFVPRRARRPVQLTLTLVALAAAVVAVAALWSDVKDTGGTDVLGGSLLVDGPTLVLQGTLALLALLAVLVIADRTDTGEDAFAPQGAAVPGSGYEEAARVAGLQQTEVYPLVLFATGGMLIFPATGDLLTLFVALEVLSLPLYLLAGLSRRRRLLSQEASMKYFLLGSFASALLLFGIALLYGFSGSLRFADIAAAVRTVTGMDGLLLAGALLVLVGLLFKVGAVPFHSWTPDVYQGAPTPITGFMAACTKVAAFGALLRVFYGVLPDLRWDLEPMMWTVAIATMVVGTVVALVQTDIKRVLAYSSIAHAGFVLTGVVALTESGITAVLFYLLAYGAATIGAFGIVSLVRERGSVRAAQSERVPLLVAAGAAPAGATALASAPTVGSTADVAGTGGPVDAADEARELERTEPGADGSEPVGAGGADPVEAGGADPVEAEGADPVEAEGPVLGEATHLSQWAGLGRTNPVLATTFALFLLSFAGIPLTAGFTGKFAVFSAAVDGGAWPLAVVGVLASAAAAFFYVRIIVLMFFTSPHGGPQDGDDEARPGAVVVGSQGLAIVSIGLCAVLTVALGVFPGPVLDAIAGVAQLLP
ncbi:NADH-quinone oxidoreductase subunit NuoN [Cellulomonas sp. ES6]|uniref:NADH-quinone oxidoreductase subunit NuoN n=1 Tax=Cellulomonas sp. ES6 TaxID=3039384 RepID=UPI0024B6485A|nr:NADH-quinone oxidoreductase subunit NuoN [Cellulomonas sp. ES6]WHP19168.1 NADH-quinone oxidoreductase subunit NuoN [Cellulomonas sp. ES6]